MNKLFISILLSYSIWVTSAAKADVNHDILASLEKDPLFQEEVLYLARTLWGEARSETSRSMADVAYVILERRMMKSYPNSVKGVVLQRLQFSCWNKGNPNRSGMLARTHDSTDPHFQRALRVAKQVMLGQIANEAPGAAWYHSYKIRVAWADTLVPVLIRGGHIFYKEA